MFRLMRNTHLILGLVFFFFAFIFAISSLAIIYRPWLPESRVEQTRIVQIEASRTGSPRALALELMRDHGLAGDLSQVREKEDLVKFQIARPGTLTYIEYVPGSSEVKVETHDSGWLETFVELHLNHGFHHDFLPANAWAVLSLLGSVALLLLGATGIYLWFCLHEERAIGSVLLVLGLIYGLTSLIWSRMV